jgi:hypothetical protein
VQNIGQKIILPEKNINKITSVAHVDIFFIIIYLEAVLVQYMYYTSHGSYHVHTGYFYSIHPNVDNSYLHHGKMAAEVEWWSSGEEEAWVKVERKLVEDLKTNIYNAEE